MSAQKDLEAQIRQDFNNWENWLVYADWLLEQGDERGKLIMLKHRVETASLSSDECDELQAQINVLAEPHQAKWLSGYKAPKGTIFTWHHGFVVGVDLKELGTNFEFLIELRNHHSACFLTKLNLYGTCIGSNAARALAQSEHFRALTVLNLGYNYIRDDGARELAQCEHLNTLTELYLGYNYIGNEGTYALAESEHLRGLKRLDLNLNDIENPGARALAQSEHLQSLTWLRLWNNKIEAQGKAALKNSKHLKNCKIEF